MGYLSSRPKVVGALVVFACVVLLMLLLVGSLAFVLMRLRRPRPSLECVLLQPGMVAVEAMWAGFVTSVIFDALGFAAVFGRLALASAVPAAWTALALAGRWKPELGWIDRFGRAIGARWCLLILLYLSAVLVFQMLFR